jgi:hypothetical protein
MKENMEQHYLQTITIAENKVQWLKKGKEILVSGKMFDIKSSEKEGSQFIFTGLFDEEETALVKMIENDFNKKNESGKLLFANVFQLLFSAYPVYEIPDFLFSDNKKIFYNWFNNNYSFVFKSITTPPPRC